MTDAFDPYFKWLGIPKADQPPHAYRLLGIELFESDADVISNAADGRMAQIKSYQTGKFGAVSQKLLNEIAAAKVCLLKLEKKTEYDRRLRQHLQQKAGAQEKAPLQVAQVQSPPVAQAVAAPAQSAGLSFLDDYATAPTRTTARTATKVKKSNWLVPAVIGIAAVALAGGAVGFYIFAGGGDKLDHSQASLQGDNHHAALASGSAAAQVKPAGSGESRPRPSGKVPAETNDSGHAADAKPSAVPPATDVDTESKPKPDVVPKPDSPQPDESPKGAPDKAAENPAPDQTPPKEESSRKKSPMPGQAQFQAMKSKVLKIFQKDYADAKTPQGKLALAAKLDAQADSSKGDPVERFTLWRMAADKAVDAGDVSAAVDIIDKISAQFDGDTEAIKYELLSAGAARATSTPEGARNLCETAMKLAAAAVTREDFDAAFRYAKLATGTLRRVKDPQFSRDVVAHDHEIERLKNRYSAVAKAMETLKDDPDNAAANLTVGQWRCFIQGDWTKGLPYLAKGSRDELAHLAKQELAKPGSAPEQAAIGDGWWALAEKDRTETKAGFRARALYWYEQASPGLSGLEKVRVEKQIETMAKASGGDPHQASPAPKVGGARGVVQKGNVALLSNATTVEGPTQDPTVMLGDNILPGRASQARFPCEFTVTLAKVYQLRQIRVRIYDSMSASFAVLVSRDGRNFDLVEDHRRENLREWQDFQFSPRPVKAVKLVFTGSSGSFVELAKFEAYCVPIASK